MLDFETDFRRNWRSSQRAGRLGFYLSATLPELMPLYSARPKRGDLVCAKGTSLTDVWRVLKLTSSRAECVTTQSEERRTFGLDDLVVVRQFGEPIFPSLMPMGKLESGTADQPWHTLIEADNYHALQLLEYLYKREGGLHLH